MSHVKSESRILTSAPHRVFHSDWAHNAPEMMPRVMSGNPMASDR